MLRIGEHNITEADIAFCTYSFDYTCQKAIQYMCTSQELLDRVLKGEDSDETIRVLLTGKISGETHNYLLT